MPKSVIFERSARKHSREPFRSLGKQLLKDGKLITQPYLDSENDLFVNANVVGEEDIKTGWIYVLKSKSTNPNIASIQNLYKIWICKLLSR